jgi:TolA-binding protein
MIVPKSVKRTPQRKSTPRPRRAPQAKPPEAAPERAETAPSPAPPQPEITLHASRRFWLLTLGALVVVLGAVQTYGYLTGWGDPERLVQRHFSAAQRLTLAKRFDAALGHYEKVLALKTSDDNHRQALIGMADLLRERQQGDRAIALYDQLRQRDPNNVLAAWAGLQIADIELESGKTEAARASFARVAQAFPRSDWDAEARLGLGRLLEKEDKLRDAIAQYQGLVRDYGGGFLAAEALVRIGRCQELLGDPDAARRAYQTVLDKYPASTWDEAKAQLERLDRGAAGEGVRTWGNGR